MRGKTFRTRAAASWLAIVVAAQAHAGDVHIGRDQAGPSMHATDAIVEMLADSPDPRFAALAASASPTDRRAARLADVAVRAPDDAFVQWVVASKAEGALRADAIDALVRIAPDDAATWLFALSQAVAAGDDAATAAALARMAKADRFDDRYSAFMVEWLRAAQDHGPFPGADGPRSEHDTTVLAVSFASAHALPSFRPLTLACGVPGDAKVAVDLDPVRRDDCRAIGLLLAARGDTLVSRGIGGAVLRAVDAPERDEQARIFAYQYGAHTNDIASSHELMGEEDTMRTLAADWREGGTEMAVLERRLARAGVPFLPPDDWRAPERKAPPAP